MENIETRMPDHQIDSVLAIAKMRDAIVFLDIQVGLKHYRRRTSSSRGILKITKCTFRNRS